MSSDAVELTGEELAGLGPLARIAWQAWAEDAPTALSLMPDPREHFSVLGERAQMEEDRMVPQMQGPDRPGETTAAKAGRIRQAQSAARETVIAEMLRPPESLRDPEETLVLDHLDLESQALRHSLLAFHLLPWVDEAPEPGDLEDEDQQTWQETAGLKPLEAARRLGRHPSPAKEWETYRDYLSQSPELDWLETYYRAATAPREDLIERAKEYLGLI